MIATFKVSFRFWEV